MRIIFSLFWVSLFLPSYAQLNERFVEGDSGTISYAYHANGKISTEIFQRTSGGYADQGYARAYNAKGELIYNQPISRQGLISSVNFSYFRSGAVSYAEYNAHPDAGIQWYEKVTSFDESGRITMETQRSHDDYQTILYSLPDSTVERLERERIEREREAELERVNQQKRQFMADSLAFYVHGSEQLEDGTTLTFISDPEKGCRHEVITKNRKELMRTTLFFDKQASVKKIIRTYHKNGRIDEERIFEQQVWHYRKYDKSGRLVQEIMNQPLAN